MITLHIYTVVLDDVAMCHVYVLMPSVMLVVNIDYLNLLFSDVVQMGINRYNANT